MRMRPELVEERDHRWDRERVEAQRIMDRFGIAQPRCGFGVGMGWLATVERAFEKMVAAGWDRDLHQVKQKMCGLRIYIGTGAHDDVDNPVKKFIRGLLTPIASSNRVPGRLRSFLWSICNSRLLKQWRPNAIERAIREAENECDRLCENCGKERETKGFGWGMALCDTCGLPMERR